MSRSVRRSPFRLFVVTVMLTALLAGGGPAVGEAPSRPSGHVSSPPQSFGFDGRDDLLPRLRLHDYAPKLPAGDDASESWELLAWFPSGYTITVRLMITNQGPGDGTGLAVSTVTRPGGATEVMRNSRDRGDWTWSAEPDTGFTVRLATHELLLDDPDYHLSMDYEQAVFELRGHRRTPAYRPGVLRYADRDDYLALLVMAPRLDVVGNIRFPDGTAVPLEDGRGVLLRSESNMEEEERYLARFRVDGFASDGASSGGASGDGTTEISYLEVSAPRRESYRRAGYMLLIRNDRVLLATREVAHRHWEYAEGPERPVRRVPARSELWGWGPDNPRAERPDVTAAVSLQVQHQLNVVDLISSAAARFFVRMSMNPVRYQLRGDYELRWSETAQPATGVAVASLSLPEDPPQEY